MRVLIVSKTQMGGNTCCVGGLSLVDNKSVRLMRPGKRYQPNNTNYQIGQIWEIQFEKENKIKPPHVENIIVKKEKFLSNEHNIKDYLLKNIIPWRGDIKNIFDGLLKFTNSGKGYISHEIEIPRFSTGYWLPDKPLNYKFDEERKRVYYSYSFFYKIKYVGYEEPINTIPANALIRVSLATWWIPPDSPDMEERCYLQLSGWYL